MDTPARPGAAADEARSGGPAPVPNAALFLDIDGTLVGFADHPREVRIDAGLRDLLARVALATGGAVALISGRALADIDALFAPSRHAAAGQHGAERRAHDGSLHRHAPPGDRLREAARDLAALMQRHAGLVLEDKGASLALHYRQAPAAAALVEREMRRWLEALGDDFALQAGKCVLELRPGGKDKGTAIAEFLAEPPFRGRTPVFVGDDLTDEPGFGLVNRLGGQTVKVGPGPTCARWRLPDASAVRRWLAAYADTLAGVGR